MKKSLLTIALIAACTAAASGSTVIRNYQPLRHDRFYTGIDKAFVGDPYDFSGVGFSGGQNWATLISDCYFISAFHYHAAISDVVTFWENNNPAGPTHNYTVAGGQQIGSTDLWVGWFSAAVDSSIARYSVLDLPTYPDYLGLTLFNYGVSYRVGRNVLDDSGLLTVGPSTGVVMGYDYDNSDTPSVGGDETFIQVGDSGAPSFTVFDGKLSVLGVHWAISDAFPGTDEGESSYDTFVPTYIAELNAVLADKGQSVTVVPEPGSALLLLLGAAGLAGRPRQRRALQAAR